MLIHVVAKCACMYNGSVLFNVVYYNSNPYLTKNANILTNTIGAHVKLLYP